MCKYFSHSQWTWQILITIHVLDFNGITIWNSYLIWGFSQFDSYHVQFHCCRENARRYRKLENRRLQLQRLQVHYLHLIQTPFDTEDPIWWRWIKSDRKKKCLIFGVKYFSNFYPRFIMYPLNSNAHFSRSFSNIRLRRFFRLKI